MQTFELKSLLAEAEKRQQPWLEFLRVPALSLGLYALKAGQVDSQRPHTEEEVYFVLGGKAKFQAGSEQQAVGPGTLLFVARGVEHHFYEITEDLTLLVFFAPAEGSGNS